MTIDWLLVKLVDHWLNFITNVNNIKYKYILEFKDYTLITHNLFSLYV